MKNPIKIALTGATGNISYSAIFRLAAGEAFGADQPLIISLYDLPGQETVMEGLAMELADCCTPLVQRVETSCDLDRAFEGADYALLVGAKPRTKGMERSDLLAANGKIFIEQGKALNRSANRDVKVVVVGNPCNTNALVAMHHAPDLKRENFHAMLRLDQNRAVAQLAHKANVTVDVLSNVVVWGNHSPTMVPDVSHATIAGKALESVITDEAWLQGPFLEKVQKRGAEVIGSLGRSSAASAAKAAIDELRSLYTRSQGGEWFTSGVISDDNPFGFEEGLIIGMPCLALGDGKYDVVKDLKFSSFIEKGLEETIEELKREREYCVKEGII